MSIMFRNAFGGVERGEDPVHLAEADYYNLSNNSEYLNKIKAGAGYVMEIYNHPLMDEKELEDPDDYEKMKQLLAKVMNAQSGQEVIDAIEEHKKFLEDVRTRADR